MIAHARTGDAVAISLSGLCLVHCLALPLVTGFLPLLGTWAEAEWVHLGFVGLAIPVSIWTLSRSPRDALPKVVAALAAGAFVLLFGGAVGYPDESLETPLTVAGGLMLAAAHLVNWRHRRPGPGCGTPAGPASPRGDSR